MPPFNVLVAEEEERRRREDNAEEHEVQEGEENAERKWAEKAAYAALRLRFELGDLAPGRASAAAAPVIVRLIIDRLCDGRLDRRDGRVLFHVRATLHLMIIAVKKRLLVFVLCE